MDAGSAALLVLRTGLQGHGSQQKHRRSQVIVTFRTSITVVIFCWHICLISESMGHHDSEIMDDRSID
jgi:bacteriorhodopsin